MDCVAICHAKSAIDSNSQMLRNMTSHLCRRTWCRTFSSVSVKNVRRVPKIISDPGYRMRTSNWSVTASGVEWIADRLRTVLPSTQVLHVMPQWSTPNLLLDGIDAHASTATGESSCVGLVVKAATKACPQRSDAYYFNRLPVGLPYPSLLVSVCPAAGYIWLHKTDDLRVARTRFYSSASLDLETFAHRLCEMVKHDGDLARFSKVEWVRLSCIRAEHKRARGLLAQLLEIPAFHDIEFCKENTTERPYNAVLCGKRILYRTQSKAARGSLFIGPGFNYERGGLQIQDDVDAVVLIIGDKDADFCSVKYVGILPKSLLDERGMLGVDGVKGKNTVYVRHDLDFSRSQLQGLEPYFLNIMDASPDEIANFVSEKLG